MNCSYVNLLQARRAYHENTRWGKITVFTRSAITPPKVNRFGWNLEQMLWAGSGRFRARFAQ